MSSNAKFCYFNLIAQDTTEIAISSGGENPFYPVSNLKHPHALKTFRSSTSVTSVIVLDFQNIVNVQAFLAIGSSIGTLDLTAVTIEANALDIWTSPAFSYTVTDFDYTENFASAFFATQSYRYWRLTLTGTSGYVEVGKLFLGDVTQFTSNNVSIGFQHGREDLSTVVKGRYGQRFIDVITDLKQFKGSIGLMTLAEQATLAAMYDYLGKSTPFWFVPDPDQLIVDNKDRLSGYYYFTERPQFTNDFFGLYSSQFELEEAK